MTAIDENVSRCWIALQAVGVLVGFAMLLAWPPRHGMVLLVPLGTVAAERLVSTAVDQHALVIGAGPLPHSYVVRGDRTWLGWAMLSRGILPIAASGIACGSVERAA